MLSFGIEGRMKVGCTLILNHLAIVLVVVDNELSTSCTSVIIYEGWNFNFGNTPLDWIQELLE